jgi:hypothetical protein
MDISNLARQILADMWEYGRIVLIIGFVAIVWGVLLGRYEDENERPPFQLGLLLIALGIVGGFALFSFLNVEAGNLIVLMRARPAWGIFTGFVALLMSSFVVAIAYRSLTTKRKESAISIRDTAEALPKQFLSPGAKTMFMTLLLLAITSIAWLWLIAR